MVTVYDVPANELIIKLAEKLKKTDNIKSPDWAIFVKTGCFKERPPVDKDWWFIRAASILRTVERLGPIGVSKLRVKYGGKKNRGHKPEHFFTGSGKIIRLILQQLEKEGLIVKVVKGVHKGKVVTPVGNKLLNDTAKEISPKVPNNEKVEKGE